MDDGGHVPSRGRHGQLDGEGGLVVRKLVGRRTKVSHKSVDPFQVFSDQIEGLLGRPILGGSPGALIRVKNKPVGGTAVVVEDVPDLMVDAADI